MARSKTSSQRKRSGRAKKTAKKKAAKKKAAKKKTAKKKTAKKKTAKKKTAKKKTTTKKTAKKKTTTKKTAKKKTTTKKTAVDRWVNRLTASQQRIVGGLRELVRKVAPELEEAIKWNQPVYSGRQPICYIMARSAGHVTFGFWRGKALDDPGGHLEGSGSRMRHVKLRRLSDVPSRVLETFVARAVEIDARGDG